MYTERDTIHRTMDGVSLPLSKFNSLSLSVALAAIACVGMPASWSQSSANSGQSPAPVVPLMRGDASAGVIEGGTGSSLLNTGTSSSIMQANIEHSSEPINILFLVDASYSMKEKFGGGDRKMNSAKQVLEQALTRIPSDVNLGLRVFGQSYSGLPEIDCRQTALLVPIGAHNRNSLIQAIRTIQPSGLTPLELALRASAEGDFARAEGAKIIILISDGMDTCGGNPCAFISKLADYGIRIKCDVVGLQLKNDRKAQEQLNCIAQASGGKYFDANSAGDLIESVARSVDKAISGKVIIKPRPTPTSTAPTSSPTNTAPQSAIPLDAPAGAPTTGR